MYLEYCLIANATICIIGVIHFFVLKKKKQTNMKNTLTLIFSTVLAMVGASLIPFVADYLIKGLSLSVPVSLVAAFFFVAVLALVVFYLLHSMFIKKFEKEEETETDESGSISESIIEDSFQDRTGIIDLPEQNEDTIEISGEVISAVIEGEISDGLPAIEKQEEEKQSIPEVPEYDQPVFAGFPEYNADKQSEILKLIEIAMEDKTGHNYKNAITAFESALILGPDDELCFLIILDLCSLYKMTGNTESIYKLLDSAQCNLLSTDKKEEILRNIKIS